MKRNSGYFAEFSVHWLNLITFCFVRLVAIADRFYSQKVTRSIPNLVGLNRSVFEDQSVNANFASCAVVSTDRTPN
ncbi:hypothetical protein [Chamaesiphon sp. GL140_3_metabinner_50]|uniref:hypothetical protein n=1 Tax=Chamaesiphon sp. GL140_3_metabinner_50 TaxID=2970812 RepID=UPI0025FF15E7|nr:hypothetical protein [Chamaesiphon sp. GL140_3_metabinner_50]